MIVPRKRAKVSAALAHEFERKARNMGVIEVRGAPVEKSEMAMPSIHCGWLVMDENNKCVRVLVHPLDWDRFLKNPKKMRWTEMKLAKYEEAQSKKKVKSL